MRHWAKHYEGTTGTATFNVPATVNTVIAEVIGGGSATYLMKLKMLWCQCLHQPLFVLLLL